MGMPKHVLVLLQDNPVTSSKSAEGVRCAYGLSCVGTTHVALALCDEALDFLLAAVQASANPAMLQTWRRIVESGLPIHRLRCPLEEQNPTDKRAQVHTPEEWVELALNQDVILLF